jgi:hypothetical protein
LLNLTGPLPDISLADTPPTTTPEPSTVSLLVGALLILARRRVRSSAKVGCPLSEPRP